MNLFEGLQLEESNRNSRRRVDVTIRPGEEKLKIQIGYITKGHITRCERLNSWNFRLNAKGQAQKLPEMPAIKNLETRLVKDAKQKEYK